MAGQDHRLGVAAFGPVPHRRELLPARPCRPRAHPRAAEAQGTLV